MEALAAKLNVHRRLVAACIGGTRGEEAPRDIVVYLLFVPRQPVGMGRGVDRRVRLVVFAPIAWPLKLELVVLRRRGDTLGELGGEPAPRRVARLLCDERGKVKVFVVLVRLGTGVGKETALIQRLGHVQHTLRCEVKEARRAFLQLDRRQGRGFAA